MTLGDEIFQLPIQTGHNFFKQLLATSFPFWLTLLRHDNVSFQLFLTYHTQITTLIDNDVPILQNFYDFLCPGDNFFWLRPIQEGKICVLKRYYERDQNRNWCGVEIIM